MVYKDQRKVSPEVYSKSQHNIDQSLINKNAKDVINFLTRSGYKSYVVGGGVRDLLLGKKPKDFDIATNATPEQIKKVFHDIMFVPLVAFDKRLYRIGYGGGYYDRYIEKLSNKKNLLKIGIAHSCQKINRVPTNKYDKKLDIIITEKYVLR